jgi:hypothetical protein
MTKTYKYKLIFNNKMKKEIGEREDKIFLIAGIIASIIMITIVLAFIRGSLNGNTILKSSSESDYNKQEIMNNKSILNETLRIKELSGSGNAYLCVDYEGKIFRSKIPCL